MTPQHPPDTSLLHETGTEVVRRLRTARNANDVMGVVQWGAKEMNRTLARSSPELRSKVACKSGCSFCCHIPLGVQAHEVFLAADYIVKTFTPEELHAVIERARRHRETVAGISGEASSRLRQTCPLLRDGHCSIYQARPEVSPGTPLDGCRNVRTLPFYGSRNPRRR